LRHARTLQHLTPFIPRTAQGPLDLFTALGLQSASYLTESGAVLASTVERAMPHAES
jgi:hypothetical protein